jgi:hypothetical protein
MTKHYSSKDGGSLAFRWYMSHDTYETYSVVARTKSEEGHLVNRTFDINLNRGDWTRDQLERWLEAGMSTYASRAHARVATDNAMISIDDPSPVLEAFGHRLMLLKPEAIKGQLDDYAYDSCNVYALSPSSDVGIILYYDRISSQSTARLVFNATASHVYVLGNRLKNGISRRALEKELDSRVVGSARVRIIDALNDDAARIAKLR